MSFNIKNSFNRDTIIYKVETSGLNPKSDELLEIIAIKIKLDGKVIPFNEKFKPYTIIRPEITKLNGHSNNSLNNEDTFQTKAKLVYNFFKDCDLIGYNSNRFDYQFIYESLSREKLFLDSLKNNRVDLYKLLVKFESRKFEDVYERTFNEKINDLKKGKYNHIFAVMRLLNSQIESFNLESKFSTLEELASLINNNGDEVILDSLGFFKVIGEDLFFAKGSWNGLKVIENKDKLISLISNQKVSNETRVIGNLFLKTLFKKDA